MRCGRAAAACASSAVAAATNPARAIDAGHRSPRRDRGAPAAAVRVLIRVRAHLRRSWCTLAEKRDEIAKGLRKPSEEYRPCQPGPQAGVAVQGQPGSALTVRYI